MPKAQAPTRSYKQSVGRRLFYTHLWVGLALALAVAVYFYFAAERALGSAYNDRLVEATRALGLSLDASTLEQGRAPPTLVAQLNGVVVRHELLTGAAIYDTGYGGIRIWAQGGDNRAPESLQIPRIEEADIRNRVFELDGKPTRTLMPLSRDRLLLVSASNKQLDDYLAELRRNGAVAFIAAVLMSALIASLLARDAKRILRRFAKRCQQIAEGRYKSEDATPPLAEFAEFAESLEAMAARLERTDAERGAALEQAKRASAQMEEHVRERTAALEQAKRATAQMEEHVRERTAALEQAKRATAQLEENVRERNAELERLNVHLRQEIEQRCQMEAVLAEAAATDPLTRLLNRRGMVELLEQLADRSRKQQRHFCVAIADIDHFKRINDGHGHQMGDYILVAVADRLRTDLKFDEEGGRWGGEEFLLVWPDLNLAGAEERANVLRESLAAQALVEGGPMITLSFGLAEYRGTEELDACLVRADRALYEAKDSGRNRVIVSHR